MFCQLEVLRDCLPPSVRRTLDELPESLDETYERVLKEIKKPNREHARRFMQCLVVAIRPLDVKELAEVLAVDFDDAEGIPKLKTDWRWEDEEQALLTSCSSLITIVETEDSRVVQFSHFSVKEYLTSAQLATSSGDMSRYHIVLEPAHTILAQACMGVLLQPHGVEENSAENNSPFAGYAAQYWVTHAQFERASSFLRKPMEYLFDLDKPYFEAWLQLHDIDTPHQGTSSLTMFAVSEISDVTPLYIAALCGFEDLVEHLVIKYPQHMNTSSGRYVTPLIAALAGRHFQIAKLLHHNGAHMNTRGNFGETPLNSAAWYGDLEMVQILLDYKVDVNACGDDKWTAMHYVPRGFKSTEPHKIAPLWFDVTRLLLEHGADINARNDNGSTPLHLAAEDGSLEVVRVLLEHGANVGVQDNEGRTPLYVAAAGYERVEVVRMLLEHGANVGAKDNRGRTPLHAAAAGNRGGVVRVLLEHGAVVAAEDNKGRTAFQLASAKETMELLVGHGATGV